VQQAFRVHRRQASRARRPEALRDVLVKPPSQSDREVLKDRWIPAQAARLDGKLSTGGAAGYAASSLVLRAPPRDRLECSPTAAALESAVTKVHYDALLSVVPTTPAHTVESYRTVPSRPTLGSVVLTEGTRAVGVVGPPNTCVGNET